MASLESLVKKTLNQQREIMDRLDRIEALLAGAAPVELIAGELSETSDDPAVDESPAEETPAGDPPAAAAEPVEAPGTGGRRR